MDIFLIYFWQAIFILLFDALLNISTNRLSFSSEYRHPKLLAWLFIINLNEYKNITYKSNYIYQSFLLVIFIFFYFFIMGNFCLNFLIAKNQENFIAWALLLVIFPFVHLLFALLKKNDLLSIYSSTDSFRTRLCVALSQSCIIIFNYFYTKDFPVSNIFFSILYLIGISYLVNLTSFVISEKSKNFTESNIDYSFGPARFYYYLFSVIEILYSILLYFYLFIWKHNETLQKLLTNLTGHETLLLSFFCLAFIVIILAKLLKQSESILTKKFMRMQILVINFFVMGLCVLLEKILSDLKM